MKTGTVEKSGTDLFKLLTTWWSGNTACSTLSSKESRNRCKSTDAEAQWRSSQQDQFQRNPVSDGGCEEEVWDTVS